MLKIKLSPPKGISEGKIYVAYLTEEKYEIPSEDIKFPRGYYTENLKYFVFKGEYYGILSEKPNLILSKIRLL